MKWWVRKIAWEHRPRSLLYSTCKHSNLTRNEPLTNPVSTLSWFLFSIPTVLMVPRRTRRISTSFSFSNPLKLEATPRDLTTICKSSSTSLRSINPNRGFYNSCRCKITKTTERTSPHMHNIHYAEDQAKSFLRLALQWICDKLGAGNE